MPIDSPVTGSPDAASRQHRYRPGDLVALTLGPITNRGAAIAHTDEGQAVFVAFGAEGEEVVATVDRVHKDRLEAHVVEVIQPSPSRVQPACPYFGACGGCSYQHLTYEHQLEVKRSIVCDTLRRIGHFDGLAVPATVPSPSPWFYRNQARFSTNRWGEVGFTRRGSRHVLPIHTCFILEPALTALLPDLQGKGAGLHQIVARTGVATGDLLIAPDLADRGLVQPSGQRSVSEEIAGERFEISPSAFFQVNSAQAGVLVRLAAQRLQLRSSDLLADLYAGVGFFSKILARSCRAVAAVEVSHQAAIDAQRNLASLANVTYYQGEVERVLPELPEQPARILLDPSREGCTPAALEAIVATGAGRVVYVSCDAATLARDLRRLVDGGYTLEEVQPLDMFPQTFHVECLATLSREAAP